MSLDRRRGVVRLLRMRLLLVRVLWLRRLRWLCGVCSIIHRLLAPSHVWLLLLLLLLRLLLLLSSGIRRLTVPAGMVSERVRRRLLLLLQWLLQWLLVLQRRHRCRLHRTP